MDRSSLFRLGMKLNLSHDDVDDIFNDRNTKTYQKAYKILLLWRNQAGQQANLNDIITILKEINKNAIAENIMTMLHLSSLSSY